MAAEAGVDIADTAFNSMSGLTSSPALNSIVAALENTSRDTGFNTDHIQKVSDYWSAVRPVYKQFESDLKSGTAEIYKYEIPGGQYSNLKPQVESFGLGHRFNEVKQMFKEVNDLLGDIVKVTPSSKMVGDLAIFMVKNDLTAENIYDKGKSLAFPDSVVDYFKGMMGQPEGGFPSELQKIVLKGEEPITCRPGELLPNEDLDKIQKDLKKKYGRTFSRKQALSYALYPKVYEDYLTFKAEFGDLSRMGSDIFFHGLSEGETCEVEIANGKTLIIKLLSIGNIDPEGNRNLVYEVNGYRREIKIKDKNANAMIGSTQAFIQMADPNNKMELGASIPGTVVKVLVKEGDLVKKDQSLVVIEAMKMETNITASFAGKVDVIKVKEGQQVKAGELLIKLIEN